MAKANFYLKNPSAIKVIAEKSKKSKETLIYLFFSYNGNRFKYSAGQTILPKDWNNETQRAKKSLSGCLELNHLLDRIEEEIKKIYRNGITQNHTLTNEYFKEKLDRQINPGSINTKGFFDYLDEFIEIQKPTKSHRTIQKYTTLKNHLTDFQKRKHYTISFEKIDSKFYEYLSAYFINDLLLLNNSSAKYIKTLKTYLSWATERGYNSNISYEKFKATEKDADIIYLTEKELFTIYEFDFSKEPHLARTRDTFCFGCFTGLRYSDIKRVTKKNIKGKEASIISEKTSDSLIIPLNDYALEILKKNDFSLPHLSNQKTNENLKEIGKKAKINDEIVLTKFRGAQELQITKPKFNFLTSHTARRTFVTLSLEKGMRPETVMAITGHKQYATFKKYIKITDKVKNIEMDHIWNKTSNLLKVI